jgi:putative transposase
MTADGAAMTHAVTPDLSKHHRFLGEIIRHAVWLYFRFPLSHRDVEELLWVQGVIVSYEAIRKWCRKCGQQCANQLRRRRLRPGDKWGRVLDLDFIASNDGVPASNGALPLRI